MPNSLFEHPDLVQIILVGAIGYIVWSLRRTMNGFERSISKLFTLYEKHNTVLMQLVGEHDARTGSGIGCGWQHRRRSDHIFETKRGQEEDS